MRARDGRCNGGLICTLRRLPTAGGFVLSPLAANEDEKSDEPFSDLSRRTG